MTEVVPRTTLRRHIPRLTAAAVACCVATLGGCSDYFAQREMDAVLASWVGRADVERADSMNMVAALASVKASSIDDESPLGKVILERPTVEANGYMFSRTSHSEGRYVYRRQDGQMTVVITKESDTPDGPWLVFVSHLEFAE